MAARKSPATMGQDFVNGVNAKAANYVTGVQDNSVDWAAGATSPAATQRRDSALIAAIQAGTINEGIRAVGNAKWRANAVAKGGANWRPQTVAAATKYQAGMTTVANDWGGADAAMATAGDGATAQSRRDRAAAWSKYMHDAARQRKGLPAD